jgi:DivIVA domain-containing protein
MDQIRLTVDDIVNKEFKKSMRGYNEEEVDKFLDIVIEDYETFLNEIERLNEEIERLKKFQDHSQNRRSSTNQPISVNYDILKRISNLEKAVFGPQASEGNE